MSLLRLKDAAVLLRPAPAGFKILAMAYEIALDSPADVVITSGQEDRGRLPTDTHMRGEAYDFSVAGLDPQDIFTRYKAFGVLLGPQFLILFEVPPAQVATLPQPLKDLAYVNAKATGAHLHVALKKDVTFP